MGVVLACMVNGKAPWRKAKSSCTTYRKYVALREEFWAPHLSDNCKDILTKILDPDPKKRLSLSNMLKHKWLAEAAAQAADSKVEKD